MKLLVLVALLLLAVLVPIVVASRMGGQSKEMDVSRIRWFVDPRDLTAVDGV